MSQVCMCRNSSFLPKRLSLPRQSGQCVGSIWPRSQTMWQGWETKTASPCVAWLREWRNRQGLARLRVCLFGYGSFPAQIEAQQIDCMRNRLLRRTVQVWNNTCGLLGVIFTDGVNNGCGSWNLTHQFVDCLFEALSKLKISCSNVEFPEPKVTITGGKMVLQRSN